MNKQRWVTEVVSRVANGGLSLDQSADARIAMEIREHLKRRGDEPRPAWVKSLAELGDESNQKSG